MYTTNRKVHEVKMIRNGYEVKRRVITRDGHPSEIEKPMCEYKNEHPCPEKTNEVNQAMELKTIYEMV
jgi:hypothetical protein